MRTSQRARQTFLKYCIEMTKWEINKQTVQTRIICTITNGNVTYSYYISLLADDSNSANCSANSQLFFWFVSFSSHFHLKLNTSGVFACVSVCHSVCEHISGTTHPRFTAVHHCLQSRENSRSLFAYIVKCLLITELRRRLKTAA